MCRSVIIICNPYNSRSPLNTYLFIPISYIYFINIYKFNLNFIINHRLIMNAASKEVYYDPELITGDTENGKEWLSCYVHPPSCTPGSTTGGYPDRSTIPSIQSFYKLVKEAAPYPIAGGKDILILQAPGLLNPVFAANFIGPHGASQQNGWFPIVQNTQVQGIDILRNFGRARLNAYSVTKELDATAFNNSGMLREAQFNPSVYIVDVGELLDILDLQGRPKDKEFARRVVDRYTRHHGKQFTDWYEVRKTEPRSVQANWSSIQIVDLGKPIAEPDDVTMLSPKSTSRRATKGSFMVHQINQDTNRYMALQPGNVEVAGNTSPNANLLLCAYQTTWYDTIGAPITYVESFELRGSEPEVDTYDIPWGDWSWGVCYLENINSSNGGALIDFKVVQRWQYTPKIGGFTNQFATAPPLYDPTAIKNGTIIKQAAQDSVEAKYNSLGAMMPAVLSAIAPSVVPEFTKALQPPKPQREKDAVKAAEIVEAKEQIDTREGESTLATIADETALKPSEPIIRNMASTGGLSARFSRQPSIRRRSRSRSASVSRLTARINNLTRMISQRPRSLSRRRRAATPRPKRRNSRRRPSVTINVRRRNRN